VEVKEHYHIKISNKFVALEDLSGGSDTNISVAWENITVYGSLTYRQSTLL
jgi:hypothetical protein